MTTTPTSTERDAFEADVRQSLIGTGSLARNAHGKYSDDTVADHWETWQTAWHAALAQPVPAADVLITEHERAAPTVPAKQEQPPYPTGDVVGPCVCGSWPGGECLKCKRVPAKQEPTGCTRSHPHENMDAECERKTIEAHTNYYAEIARRKAAVVLSNPIGCNSTGLESLPFKQGPIHYPCCGTPIDNFDHCHICVPAIQVQEPVEYQMRMRPNWRPDNEWQAWEKCSKESYEVYQKLPIYNDWARESRALYTTPQPQQTAPLSDEILKDYEFAIALISRYYPHRAEAMSIRLRDYRAALGTQVAQPEQTADLHDAIMNLPYRAGYYPTASDPRIAYKEGHRDARHAAAELVAETATQVQGEPVAEVDNCTFGKRIVWTSPESLESTAIGTKLYAIPQPEQPARAIPDGVYCNDCGKHTGLPGQVHTCSPQVARVLSDEQIEEAIDICRSLVTWCDDNPPSGSALWFVQRARDLLAAGSKP